MNLLLAGMTIAPPAMLLLGLSSSPHCALMCAPMTQLSGSNTSWSSLLSLNIGRLCAYAVLGAAVGGAGGAVLLALDRSGAGIMARWAVAVSLITFGVLRFRASRPSRPCCPSPMAHRLESIPIIVRGALWGLIPCPLLYAVLGLSTLTGSAAEGALLTLSFGIGTAPLLLVVSGLHTVLRRHLANATTQRFSGAVLVLAGLWIGAMATTESSIRNGFCQ